MRLIPPVRLAILAAAVSLSACDLGTTDGDGSGAKVSFSLPMAFGASTIAAQRVDNGTEIDRMEVQIVVKSTGEVVLRKSLVEGSPEVTGGEDSDPIVTLGFRIPAGGETETFTLTIEGFFGTTRNYAIGPIDFQLGSDGRTATVSVQAQYVGPGSNVTGVTISPRSISIAVNQTATFSCKGTPGNVTDFPYELETTNQQIASVQTVTTLRGGTVGTTELICRLGIASRVEDRIPVTVTGGPTITVVSGGSQTALANTALPNPIVVQVRNGDGSNAGGISVTFTPNFAQGTTNPVSIATNASGQATTVWTLGTPTGTQTLKASATVGGFPVSIDITAIASGSGGQTGSITGSVLSNQAVPISGATLELRSGSNNTSGTPVATTTSSTSGSFSFGSLAAGPYTIRGTATGFSDGSANVTVVLGASASATLTLTALLTGAISGQVTNALTAVPITGATVELRSGTNNTTGALFVPAGTTPANGSFAFQGVTAGAYTVRVTATNFTPFSANVTVVANQTTQVGATLVPTGTSGVSITLSWGSQPADLDAHIFTPQGTHIFFANVGTCSSVCLDADATFGFGPETITITQQTAGDYFFHVHNFSACTGSGSGLASSGATVRVYFNGILQQTLTVPQQGGTEWGVLRLNGTTITPVNSMSPTAPAGVQCTSSGGGATAGKKAK